MSVIGANYLKTCPSRIFHFVRLSRKNYSIKPFLDSPPPNNPRLEFMKKVAPKLIYNSEVEKHRGIIYAGRKTSRFQKKLAFKLANEQPIPLSLQFLYPDNISDEKNITSDVEKVDNIIHFPFTHNSQIDENNTTKNDIYPKTDPPDDVAAQVDEEIRKRNNLRREMYNWMSAYDNYEDEIVIEEDDLDSSSSKINYGTPDPSSAISNTPCGGCGALLHCKDTSLPGYIPSEIFKNIFEKGCVNLEALVCQRCYFLKHYNLALQVRVSPDDYPMVLKTISEREGVVVLMVDLTDFPCSIWPGIADIFGNKMPIIVVGNKVDLLPKDQKKYLGHIKDVLLNNVKLAGFGSLNIKNVAIISAKTGYGVEDLITYLNSFYRHKGDVYIVGCTNVGKSSLFNALIQSDFCKSQAIDLIQRATTSVWPGTTLNLLKFPIKRPAGYHQYLRSKRLEDNRHVMNEENKLRQDQLRTTKDPKYATLIGHIGITRNPFKKITDTKDVFHIQGNANAAGKFRLGLNENSMEYAYSKWCFDTPGVVQPDQIIHLLTAEELLLTLPKELILPRSFCIKPNSTIFIAGLSRLDYLHGPTSVRLTVFASKELPITICETSYSDEIYNKLLGSELFKVPIGSSQERLCKWPKLELARTFSVIGEDWKMSCADIVLSNSGWVAVTGFHGKEYSFAAWTPEKRGVFLRDCLLPSTIALKGHRIKGNVAYKEHKFYLRS